MNTYIFKATKGQAKYLLIVSDVSAVKALEQVTALEPDHAIFELKKILRYTTLEDYLGEKSLYRIKNHMRSKSSVWRKESEKAKRLEARIR